METNRYELVESEWKRIKDMLPPEQPKSGKRGRPAKYDNRSKLMGPISLVIKPMVRKQSESILIYKMLPIRFRRRATSTIRGPWTGTSTRSVTWLNVSSKNSNGFVGYSRAMTNSTLPSWHLSMLLLLSFC